MTNQIKQTTKLINSGCYELEQGKGSLKHYKYFYANLKFLTKEMVAEGLNLGLAIKRKDKITGKIEVYNNKSKEFVGGN
jgi:hypothetical protein